MMSGRFASALKRVPATKPSWTESVNQLAADSLRFHSLVSAGTTAEPLNQSDMPRSSATASTARMRQRDDGVLSESVGPNKAPDCNSKAPLGAGEIGGQRSEVRGRRSEVRSQKSQIRSER